MQLTDRQLNDYIDDVLFFGREEKQRYERQIDHLKQTLVNALQANSSLRAWKILHAGSWHKGTALRPFGTQDIDIDIILYLNVPETGRGDLADLHPLLLRSLRAAYPTKDPNDFTTSRKTVGIEFRTSGLLVDLVPVIPTEQPEGYVWQTERGGRGTSLTSPEGQLEFIRQCKARDPRYVQVVRLAKRWRNHRRLHALPSFAIELLVAHLGLTQGVPDTIEQGFYRFFLYLVRGLKERITFPGALGHPPRSACPVQIHDPTNNENNVTARMEPDEVTALLHEAVVALQAVNHAMSVERRGDTEKLWKQVLGPEFSLSR
ncbi:hypothetical protein ATI61_10675 [Archangium gephyra]|uniref:Nucleotidyltransferase n=1 Tax=Archangium gephyra TaxID=48 RepID=A0AAC8Q0D4_9BACT|nr:CBASS oligonucleotide cyclase [Archangium gephyra]AKI98678.1 Hypothetical protein AA314_00305 [Archangium gephyra]REG30606.1 hypothetical protein ATI61_10675 [Archangium gephyra]